MTGQPRGDHEDLYRLLEDEILHFHWVPGDRLSEHALCERFSLSRTPVRAILQRLQENGLVKIVPHKGSVVTRLNLDTVNQLIYERMAVETMVLRDYIASATPADVEKVRYLMERIKEAACGYGTEEFRPGVFLSADYDMHAEWFRHRHLLLLWKRLSSPQSSYTRFCMLDIMAGGNVPDVLREHEGMLRLIEEGDASGVENLLREHLYGGVRRLGPELFTTYSAYFEAIES